MASRRAPGQKLFNFQASEEFIRALDEGLSMSGGLTRSDFIRQAILEKLARHGVALPQRMAAPPGRAGKGGRSKKSVAV